MGARRIIVTRKPKRTTNRHLAEVRVERASLRPLVREVEPCEPPPIDAEIDVEIGWLEADEPTERARILEDPVLPRRTPREPPPLTAPNARAATARPSRGPSRGGPALAGVPAVVVGRAALRRQPLDPRAAFVLSLVDGATPLEAILDICGMPRDEACSIFGELVQSGIVEIQLAGSSRGSRASARPTATRASTRPRASRRPPRSK